MANKIADDVLAHYGVKGMKWGVVRSRGSNGRVSSQDHIETRKLMGKAQRELTTSELQRVNNRLQAERTNKELQSRGGLQKVKTGTAIAGTILAVGATANAVYSFAKSPAGQAMKSLATNIIKNK